VFVRLYERVHGNAANCVNDLSATAMDDLDSRIHAARILVVDDNPDQLDLMELMLRKQRYTNVELTADPTSVAASYATAPYDLILLDMEMPVMNGVDVMRQLKRELKGAFMPVIVLTAHEGADVRLYFQALCGYRICAPHP